MPGSVSTEDRPNSASESFWGLTRDYFNPENRRKPRSLYYMKRNIVGLAAHVKSAEMASMYRSQRMKLRHKSLRICEVVCACHTEEKDAKGCARALFSYLTRRKSHMITCHNLELFDVCCLDLARKCSLGSCELSEGGQMLIEYLNSFWDLHPIVDPPTTITDMLAFAGHVASQPDSSVQIPDMGIRRPNFDNEMVVPLSFLGPAFQTANEMLQLLHNFGCDIIEVSSDAVAQRPMVSSLRAFASPERLAMAREFVAESAESSAEPQEPSARASGSVFFFEAGKDSPADPEVQRANMSSSDPEAGNVTLSTLVAPLSNLMSEPSPAEHPSPHVPRPAKRLPSSPYDAPETQALKRRKTRSAGSDAVGQTRMRDPLLTMLASFENTQVPSLPHLRNEILREMTNQSPEIMVGRFEIADEVFEALEKRLAGCFPHPYAGIHTRLDKSTSVYSALEKSCIFSVAPTPGPLPQNWESILGKQAHVSWNFPRVKSIEPPVDVTDQRGSFEKYNDEKHPKNDPIIDAARPMRSHSKGKDACMLFHAVQRGLLLGRSSPEVTEQLLDRMHKLYVQKDTVVTRQGQRGDFLYITGSGTFEAWIKVQTIEETARHLHQLADCDIQVLKEDENERVEKIRMSPHAPHAPHVLRDSATEYMRPIKTIAPHVSETASMMSSVTHDSASSALESSTHVDPGDGSYDRVAPKHSTHERFCNLEMFIQRVQELDSGMDNARMSRFLKTHVFDESLPPSERVHRMDILVENGFFDKSLFNPQSYQEKPPEMASFSNESHMSQHLNSSQLNPDFATSGPNRTVPVFFIRTVNKKSGVSYRTQNIIDIESLGHDATYDAAPVYGKYGLRVAVYQRGHSFGELALIQNFARHATVICRSPEYLWGLDRISFRHITKTNEQVRRSRPHTLLQNDPFTRLRPWMLKQAADAMTPVFVAQAHPVFLSGMPASHFYIVDSGVAVVTAIKSPAHPRHLVAQDIVEAIPFDFIDKSPNPQFTSVQTHFSEIPEIPQKDSHVVIAILTQGDCFGQLAIIENKPRDFSVWAHPHSDLHLYGIHKQTFQTCFGPVLENLYVESCLRCRGKRFLPFLTRAKMDLYGVKPEEINEYEADLQKLLASPAHPIPKNESQPSSHGEFYDALEALKKLPGSSTLYHS